MVYSSEINLKLNLWEDYVSPVVIALWLLFSSESLFQPNNISHPELFSQPNELFEFESAQRNEINVCQLRDNEMTEVCP